MFDAVISEPIQKIQKEIPSWQKRDTVFAVITLISSVLFVDWSVFGGFNAGFTASLLLLYAHYPQRPDEGRSLQEPL